MLKNYMEDVVDEVIPAVLTEYEDVCKCPECIKDIKALTLNSLKPMYVATEKGSLYTKLNDLKYQFRTDVMTELIKAIEVVTNNPRHTL